MNDARPLMSPSALSGNMCTKRKQHTTNDSRGSENNNSTML